MINEYLSAKLLCRLLELEGVEDVSGCNCKFEGARLTVLVGIKGHAELIPDNLRLEPIRRYSVVNAFFSRGQTPSIAFSRWRN